MSLIHVILYSCSLFFWFNDSISPSRLLNHNLDVQSANHMQSGNGYLQIYNFCRIRPSNHHHILIKVKVNTSKHRSISICKNFSYYGFEFVFDVVKKYPITDTQQIDFMLGREYEAVRHHGDVHTFHNKKHVFANCRNVYF